MPKATTVQFRVRIFLKNRTYLMCLFKKYDLKNQSDLEKSDLGESANPINIPG
jgi:hypothetical protein